MKQLNLNINIFKMGNEKEAALKPLEEAAEIFGAIQELWATRPNCKKTDCHDCEQNANKWAFSHPSYGCQDYGDWRGDIADEIADCIQACCNLADRYDINLQDALDRCYERNHERGRV